MKYQVKIVFGWFLWLMLMGTALLQKGDKTGALDDYKILRKLDKATAGRLFNKIYY